ncbi:amino acid/amide ABC transporter membrane protein 1 (HAAT family) [Blastococcus colisei]|uniref:Amino acid/amide ABC transporter membrane protein 1 (HAAT family) n=1 Tax=Blastococcus colisei TaxID=1564162 RepID=A0A543PF09_9ACTN|nr:branched-chain amino acid ABC transporter permease [Blastococcus colisei]TQN42664.1 amino acid/amide ABC transporter membrane protein 1 (HAAT family) [Blastococcus colisei]
MSNFFGLMINGLSLGAIYALIALGFVMIFKATHVLNFAHGSVLLLGAFVVGTTHDEIGFWLALLVGILAAGLAALLIDVVIMRRVRAADLGTLAILTLGVDVLMLTELTRQMGTSTLTTGAPWGTDTVSLAGATIPLSRVIAFLVTVVVVAVLWAVFKFTNSGIAMRAAAEDGGTAALMGISLNRVAATAWGVAGALAAVAGIFLTSFPSPGISPTVGLVALAAIPAWVLGGFDSFPGAVVGGLIIGVVTTLSAGYQGDLLFLGRDLAAVTPYVVMLLVLLIRPSGLFGTKEVARV